MNTLHAMGSMTSNLPIIVSSYGDTVAEAQQGADNLLRDYPPAMHGTNPGPVVQSVTGQFKCSVMLIPGKSGNVSKWSMLNP